ncbi:hypothetical protein ABW19_dt0204380 [Dactylella cylindrospora]|nr:hypothetical protein ABW19_dt0204380 [Dactylella cylindrospora]
MEHAGLRSTINYRNESVETLQENPRFENAAVSVLQYENEVAVPRPRASTASSQETSVTTSSIGGSTKYSDWFDEKEAAQPKPKPFKPIESDKFIPEYSIDGFFKTNPYKKARFRVFKYDKQLGNGNVSFLDSPPGTAVFGHTFEVTWWGSLVYHGPFESTTGQMRSEMSDEDQANIYGSQLKYANRFLLISPSNRKALELHELQTVHRGVFDDYYKRQTDRPAMVVVQRRDLPRLLENGSTSGSWRRLWGRVGHGNFREDADSGVPLLHVNITTLVAWVMSMNICEPGDVAKFFEKDEKPPFVRVRPEKKGSPVESLYYYPTIKLRIPHGALYDEDNPWNYEALPGMSFLVS